MQEGCLGVSKLLTSVGVSGNYMSRNFGWFCLEAVCSLKNTSVPTVGLQDLFNAHFGPAKLSIHGTKSPRKGSQEHLLLPWMPSGSVDCFMGCFALYPPLVLTFLFLFPAFINLLSLPGVSSPVLFFCSPCQKQGPEVLLEGLTPVSREREMLQIVAEEST